MICAFWQERHFHRISFDIGITKQPGLPVMANRALLYSKRSESRRIIRVQRILLVADDTCSITIWFYIVIAAMYCTVCRCPIAIRISRSYFLVRPGHIFFQILEAGEVVSVMESDISRLRYSFGVTPVCFLN